MVGHVLNAKLGMGIDVISEGQVNYMDMQPIVKDDDGVI